MEWFAVSNLFACLWGILVASVVGFLLGWLTSGHQKASQTSKIKDRDVGVTPEPVQSQLNVIIRHVWRAQSLSPRVNAYLIKEIMKNMTKSIVRDYYR